MGGGGEIGDGTPIRQEGEGERGRVLWVGSIPISTNHTFFLFFLNSLPLHQVFKALPTFFTKV
ncbi:hypothetical protein Hanom_Chr12g01093521 [Helianthus anomalus]